MTYKNLFLCLLLLLCLFICPRPARAGEEELKVIDTFPVNGGNGVFLSSGIEVTFNTDTVDRESLQEHLSITPSVEYFFSYGSGENTIAICPYNDYEPERQYTVTIRSGLKAGNGAVLKEDVTFSFITASEDLCRYTRGMTVAPAGQGVVVNALTNEIPAAFLMLNWEISSSFASGLPEAAVSLYRFDADSDFRQSLVRYLADKSGKFAMAEEDPSREMGRRLESTFTLVPEDVSDFGGKWWAEEYVLAFPEPLAEGKYLARLDFAVQTKHQEVTVTKYLFIQSTTLSAYMMRSGEDTIAWLHNSGDGGKAAQGAQVSLYNKWSAYAATADGEGVARLSGDDGEEGLLKKKQAEDLPQGMQLLEIDADSHSFLEVLSTSAFETGYYSSYGSANKDYFTYIYTDRQIYSTTDSIAFYGVVRPRMSGMPLPEELTVTLSQGWWGSGDIAEVTVLPDDRGYFTGTLSFEDQQAASYATLSVTLPDGSTLMNSEGFDIEDYVKPTYTSESEADKAVYLLGEGRDEEAVVDIGIHYFDETPAADFGLKNEWGSRGLVMPGSPLKADASGHIEARIGFDPSSLPDTWLPQSLTANFRSADIEDEILYISQNLLVIPRDRMILTENDPDRSTLTVHTHAVDISGITDRRDIFDTENIKGEPVTATVKASLYKCWYEKISEGMRYDPIYRESYEAYHYQYHEDLVDEAEIVTLDGKGSYPYHIEQDEENPACYYVKLSTADSAGRAVSCTAGLSYRPLGRYVSIGYGGETVYQMKAVESGFTVPDEVESWGWYYEPDSRFGEEAPAEFVLVKNGETFEMPSGAGLLTAVLKDGFSRVETGSSPERQVAFAEDLLPNYEMVGAYYDGRNAWPLLRKRMVFDYKERELSITVTPDKESYRPGETVTVTADILREKDQAPVPEGTRVVLSVVDEAIFALREQNITVLETLYRTFSQSYSEYSSRNTHSPSDTSFTLMENELDEGMVYAAESSMAMDAAFGRAAVNEEYIRSEFKDAAYFDAADTDGEGKAVFTFRIPDNMTSWRLSVIAVTEDVYAGSAVVDIVGTSPYYTVPVINDISLEGESFAIGLRSAGKEEAAGPCHYEVTVRREGEDEVLYEGSADSAALRDYTYVTLPGLREGAYKVRIKGTCGEYTDISEYPFTVVRSGLEAYVSKSGPIREMGDIHPLRYPVEVMIYDRDAYVYNAVLSRLLCSRDIRADERLGAHFAMGILAKDGSEYFAERLEDHDIADLRYIFPLFAYAKNDAEISALSYLAVPELLGSGVVRGIKREDIGQDLGSPFTGSPYAAYLLQALAGEEMEGDLSEILEDPDVSFRDKIYVMAALFTAGEEEAASAAYEALVSPKLESAEAVSGEVVYYLNADEKTTVQDDTAAALIMASLLHREEARGLALYLIEKPSDKNIYPLEEVLYLKNCEEKDGEKCAVSYQLNGETVTETLERNRRITLSLQRAALEDLALTAVSGEPYVTMFYIAGLSEAIDIGTQKLSATVSFDKASYQPGDEAKMTVTPDIGALDPSIGCSTLLLDVYIPSGMRFERYTPESYGRGWYLVSREGQRLRFLIYDGSESRQGFFTPVTFTASCVTPGEYIVESVYLSSNHYDTWGMSERGSVQITEDR